VLGVIFNFHRLVQGMRAADAHCRGVAAAALRGAA